MKSDIVILTNAGFVKTIKEGSKTLDDLGKIEPVQNIYDDSKIREYSKKIIHYPRYNNKGKSQTDEEYQTKRFIDLMA